MQYASKGISCPGILLYENDEQLHFFKILSDNKNPIFVCINISTSTLLFHAYRRQSADVTGRQR